MSSRQNNLPEVLEDAAKGNVTLDFVRHHLVPYRDSLAEIDEGFHTSLAMQEERVLEACRAAAAEAERHLNRLIEAAEKASVCVDEGHSKPLKDLGEQIRETTHDLNTALANYREVSLVAIGPTSLAGVNLILRAVNYQLEGGGLNDTSRITEAIAQELGRVEQALAQVGLPVDLAESFKLFEKTLKGLSQAVQSVNLPALEKAMEFLLASSEGLEDVLENLRFRSTLMEGPSQFSRINLLINLGRNCLEGVIAQAEFDESAETLYQNATVWRSQVGAMVRKVDNAPLVSEQGRRVDEAYESFLQLIAEFVDCVHESDGEAVEQLIEPLAQSWDGVTATQRELERLLETKDKVPCIRCGHYSRNDVRNCERCGAILPKAAEERTHSLDLKTGELSAPDSSSGESSPTQMTENLQRLFTSVDAFVNLQLDRQKFLEDVDWMMGLVRQTRQSLPGVADPAASEVAAEDGADPMALYREGLQDMEAGLGFLAQMETPSAGTAEIGTSLIWEGTGKIQRSLREQS